MNITKCDICNKRLETHSVRAGIGILREKDFCYTCGKPILDFLKKHKFIKKEEK